MSEIEQILNNEPGAWERAAAAGIDLVEECGRVAAALEGIAATRALWIVDLLAGDACPGWVAELHGSSPHAHYAFARRDVSVILDRDSRFAVRSFACAAWVLAHTPDAAMLDWYGLDEDIVSDGHFMGRHASLPIDEYARVGRDVAPLVRMIHDGDWFARAAALRMVAPSLTVKPERGADVIETLRAADHVDLADALEQSEDDESDLLFVLRAEPDDIMAVAELVSESATSEAALERLVEFVQADMPELWHAAIHVGTWEDMAMRLFCKWVTPETAELLLPYFGRTGGWMAPCAFHAYLHHASENDVAAIIDELGFDWMKCAWDRYRFAPLALRPPPYMAETQAAENDRRLVDPFNPRGF